VMGLSRLAFVEVQLVLRWLPNCVDRLRLARVNRRVRAAASFAFAWKHCEPLPVHWPPLPPAPPEDTGRCRRLLLSLRWATDGKRPRRLEQVVARIQQSPLLRHARVLLFWGSGDAQRDRSFDDAPLPTAAELDELLRFPAGRTDTLYIRRSATPPDVVKRLLVAPAFAGLDGFGFQPRNDWDAECTRALCEAQPQLRRLELFVKDAAAADSLRELARLKQLTALDVTTTRSAQLNLLSVGQLGGLRALHLQDLPDEQWVPVLSSPPLAALTELSLRVVQRPASLSSHMIYWPRAFANLTALRKLELECCYGADRILAAVGKHCRELRLLRLLPVQLEESNGGAVGAAVPSTAAVRALLTALPLLRLELELWPRSTPHLVVADWDRAHTRFAALVQEWPKRVELKIEGDTN